MTASQEELSNRVSRDREIVLGLAKALWNWQPHASQRRWLLSTGNVKTAACGRRWGKTESAAVDTAALAVLKPNSTQMIISPTYDQSRLIFSRVENLFLSSPFTRKLTKVVKTPYPKLTIGGSVIMARTADEDGRNLRGHFADRVIIDEAAYIKDRIVDEVISPMLADRNGELVMISTPFGKNHFYRSFMRGQSEKNAEGYVSFSFPSWENPHISREYIERQKRLISPRQFAVEYEARFLDNASSVFSWDMIKSAEDGWKIEDGFGRVRVCGVDWARYADYSAFCVVGVYEKGLKVLETARINNISWSDQIDLLIDLCREHNVDSIICDQTSIGDPLLEQLKSRISEHNANISANGLVFTNKVKREIVDNLLLLFANRKLWIPRGGVLSDELKYFEYELTQSGNIRMNGGNGVHDDMVIALALGCWLARDYMSCVDFYGSGRRTSISEGPFDW